MAILAAPPLFLLHEMEEYRTMLPWITKHSSHIPDSIRSLIPESPAFIVYAGVLFLVLYAIASVTALRAKPQSIAWIVFAILIFARLENAMLHIIESLALLQYTPGVLTAVLLVLPLSLYLIKNLLQSSLIRSAWLPRIVAVAFIVQSAALGGMLLLGSLG